MVEGSPNELGYDFTGGPSFFTVACNRCGTGNAMLCLQDEKDCITVPCPRCGDTYWQDAPVIWTQYEFNPDNKVNGSQD